MIRSFPENEQRSARKALWGRLQVGTASSAQLLRADIYFSHQMIASLRRQKTRQPIVLFASKTQQEHLLTNKSV